MTLTGLIRLLVDQFLPDSHQHYLFENYRRMDIYRVPAAIVPTYLKGRPRALIKHCLDRKTKSNKFTSDSIHETDTPGSFTVTKESGGNHTVTFATVSDKDMPSCTCKDWARWHIPCKHFFAIFREKKGWSWESLPNKYLQSAHLTTDNEALIDYFTSQGVPQEDLTFFMDTSGELNDPTESPSVSDPPTSTQPSVRDPDNSVPKCNDQRVCKNDSIPNQLLCCELPRNTHKVQSVQESMLRARVLLQNLKTLTYNFSDKNVSLALEFTHKLDELYQCFYSKLPNEAGIIILPDPQNSLRSTKRREHVNRNTDFSNLPPRKKYKKSSDSRFGLKADRLRKEVNSKVSSDTCIKRCIRNGSREWVDIMKQ